MAAEIDPNPSPDGDNADPEVPEHGLRRLWQRTPPGLRTVFPLALLVAVVVVGFYNWVRPSRDGWSHLPDRLVCQVQSGTVPPPATNVAYRLANNGADIRTDLGTHARRTAPDTVEMTLNLTNSVSTTRS